MKEKLKEIAKFIEDSSFFDKYGRKSCWQSETIPIYPIQTWVEDRYIEIQLDCDSCKQWHNRMLSKLAWEIMERFGDIVDFWYVSRNYGCCPDTATIVFKESTAR